MSEEGLETPFLRLARALERHEGVAQEESAPREYGHVPPLFEAAVAGVQSRMSHLSQEDILFPPHEWFDAALARQIAIHLMNSRFAVPKRRIAAELERSRESIARAIRTVDDRLARPEFAETYEAMAGQAEFAFKALGGEAEE